MKSTFPQWRGTVEDHQKVALDVRDYGHIPLSEVPPKPPGMWSKTYVRHLSSLVRIERNLYRPR